MRGVLKKIIFNHYFVCYSKLFEYKILAKTIFFFFNYLLLVGVKDKYQIDIFLKNTYLCIGA